MDLNIIAEDLLVIILDDTIFCFLNAKMTY